MHQHLDSFHNGAKYLYIFIYMCLRVLMRVHTFIHQYQYRHTNTEGYDCASIMCGDLYALTISKVSTWAVPATRLMETSFRQESFQKPSVFSAQMAGCGPPLGHRSKKTTIFLEGFSDPRVYRSPMHLCSEVFFFAT